MPMNNRTMRPKAAVTAGPTYHAEALAWRTAALANGGVVSATTMQAVSDLCNAVDTNLLRDRFVRLNLCCGDNVQAAVVPLYRGPSPSGGQCGDPVDTNVGPFVTGTDYTASGGLVGNDYKWLETGVTFNNLQSAGVLSDECHISVWRLSSPFTVSLGAYDGGGCYDNGCAGLSLDALASSGYMASVGNPSDYSIQATSIPSNQGLHLASRSGGTPAYSFNGANQTITTNNGGGIWGDVDGLQMIAHGQQYTDGECTPQTYGSQTGARMAAYSFGLSMGSNGMRLGWYQTLLAFHTAIGRA
jgi:hypothetical protein